MERKRVASKQTPSSNVANSKKAKVMNQSEAIALVQSLPRKVISLTWAIAFVVSMGADGATYRALQAMLGLRKRATVRATVLDAEIARIVEVKGMAGKRSAVYLTDFGKALCNAVLNRNRKDETDV